MQSGVRALIISVPSDALGDGKEPDLKIEVLAWRATRGGKPADVMLDDWLLNHEDCRSELYAWEIDQWLLSDDGQDELRRE